MPWHWLLLSIAALLVVITTCHGARDLFKCPTRVLKGGKVRQRSKGRVIKYICARGFQILGDKYSICVKGKWDTPVPFCISSGCAPISVAHSETVLTHKDALTSVQCDPGYKLIGSPTLRCNGRVWNASAPICQEVTVSLQRSCDFENEDLCGWTHDNNHDFDWKRHNSATPSGDFQTGPSFDHTLEQGANGHYMYIESSSPRLLNDTARLFSPFFPTPTFDTCFIFWYHMYGVSTGTLNVYLHGKSTILLFSESGDHGNQWIKAVLPLPFFRSNFQLVIEGVRGSSFTGDIAIDDVRLAEGEECFPTATTADDEATTSYDTDNNSCNNRCNTALSDSTICECTADCVISSTCCPDYLNHCSNPSSDATVQNIINPPTSEELPAAEAFTQLYNYSHLTELSPTPKSTNFVGLTSSITSDRGESSYVPQTTKESRNNLITSRLLAKTNATEDTFITQSFTSGTASNIYPTIPSVIFQNRSSETSPYSHTREYNTSTPTSIRNDSISKPLAITPIEFSPAMSKNTFNYSQNFNSSTSLFFNNSNHLSNTEQYFTRRNPIPIFTIAQSEVQLSTSVPTYSTPSRIQSVEPKTNNQSFVTLGNTKIVFSQNTEKPLQTNTTQLPLFFSSSPHSTTLKMKLPKIEFIAPPPPIVFRTPKKNLSQTTRSPRNVNIAFTRATDIPSIPTKTPSTSHTSKYYKLSTKSYWARNDVLHPSWNRNISVAHTPVVSTLNQASRQSTKSSASRSSAQDTIIAKKDLIKEQRNKKEYGQKFNSKDAVPVHDQYASASPTKKKEIYALVCVFLLILSAVLLALGVIRRRKINRGNSEYDTLDIHFLQPDEILDFTLARPAQEIAESVR